MYVPRKNELRMRQVIKAVRTAKYISQGELARNMPEVFECNQDMISKLELGTYNYSQDFIMAVRTFLGIDWIPILPEERQGYVTRLYNWLDLIVKRDFVAADSMQTQLSAIEFLAEEEELNILYQLFECRLFLETRRQDYGALALARLEDKLDQFTSMQRYHYYYNWGTLYGKKREFDKAAEYYLQAYDVMRHGLKEETGFYYNLAYCLYDQGYATKAIAFLEKAKKAYEGDNNVGMVGHVNNLLGVTYIHVGHLSGAKEALDSYLAQATRDGTSSEIGAALINLGYLYRRDGQLGEALAYLDRAVEHLSEQSNFYLEMLYQKVWCFIEQGSPLRALDDLAKGKELSQGNEKYTALFEALEQVMSAEKEESRIYLEDVAVPFFLKNKWNHIVMDFAEFLAEYYPKRRVPQKYRTNMVEFIYKARQKMMEGGVVK